MKTFTEFHALGRWVKDQSKYIDDGNAKGGGRIYDLDGRGMYVNIDGDGRGEWRLTLERSDYTARGESGLRMLERMLYEWCVSERLI